MHFGRTPLGSIRELPDLQAKILRKEFQVDQKVLVFKSRSKLIVGKLHSRWDGPFVITNVNRHQIKLFHERPTPTMGEMESISLMEQASPNGTSRASLKIPSIFMSCIEDNASFKLLIFLGCGESQAKVSQPVKRSLGPGEVVPTRLAPSQAGRLPSLVVGKWPNQPSSPSLVPLQPNPAQ
ncbi:hypothetical protein CR513_13295, partial [Mucuna pruriens]